MMGEYQEELSVCPTFNSYSSDRLDEIAARVADEFTLNNLSVLREDGGDDDFEFSLVSDGHEIPCDSQIRPIFPIFNRDLLSSDVDGDGDGLNDNNKQSSSGSVVESQIEIPFKNLFIQDAEEREPPSSSSSEVDEMESIPPGSFCVWRPKKVESSPSFCKKSNSTGSASKRWKFLNLLRRSNSDGQDSYVFLTPNHGGLKSGKNGQPKLIDTSGEVVKATRKLKAKVGVAPPSSAHEAFYVRNRAIKQGDKKKSYLPYRQDLVGFFANVSGLSRTFPPF